MRRKLLVIFVAVMLSSFSVIAPSVRAADATLSQRIESYKQQTLVKLGPNEQAIISARCKATQAVIKGYYDRAQRVRVSRGQLYNQQLAKVSTVIEALKKKGRSTKTLESAMKQFDSNIEAFKTKQSTFIDLLVDVQSIDCTKDALGFKAAVTMVLNAQKELVDASQDIKKFVNSTLKDALKEAGGQK